jgi:hypothetical protein
MAWLNLQRQCKIRDTQYRSTRDVFRVAGPSTNGISHAVAPGMLRNTAMAAQNRKTTWKAEFLPWTVTSQAMDNFIQSDPTRAASSQWRDGQLQGLATVNVTVSPSFDLYIKVTMNSPCTIYA